MRFARKTKLLETPDDSARLVVVPYGSDLLRPSTGWGSSGTGAAGMQLAFQQSYELLADVFAAHRGRFLRWH